MNTKILDTLLDLVAKATLIGLGIGSVLAVSSFFMESKALGLMARAFLLPFALELALLGFVSIAVMPIYAVAKVVEAFKLALSKA